MSSAVETKDAQPVVRISGDRVRTNSRDVATVFEMEHRNVLRSIDKLLATLPDWGPLNFEHGSYKLQENGKQLHRCFDMSRDGFCALAMRFTGDKALKWQIRYIEAFNRMEAELLRLRDEGRAVHPSTEDGLLWGQPVSKINAAGRMVAAVAKIFGPEAARELWRREPTLPPLDGYMVGEIAERGADDATGCLSHLLRIATENGQSVSALLALARTDSVAAERLKRFGVIAEPMPGSAFVAVARSHRFLAGAFAETPWVGDWGDVLLSLPGARADAARRRFGDQISRSVLVPRVLITSVSAH